MPPGPAAPRSDTVFDVARKGYDQAQVERHLRRLEAEIRILVHDRDAAADQSEQLTRELDEARARSERLRAQVRSLVAPPQSIQGMSERMRSMLRMAEDEVAEMRATAQAEAERRIAEVDQQAADELATARAQADEIRAEATRLAEQSADEQARLAAQAEAARRLVDEDFTIAMDQRRSEALRTLTAEGEQARRDIEEQRRRAAAQAQDIVTEAREQAGALLADAERKLVEMIELRGRLAVQLDHARVALERTLTGLVPLPGETGAPPAPVAQAAVPAIGQPTQAALAESTPAAPTALVSVEPIESTTSEAAERPHPQIEQEQASGTSAVETTPLDLAPPAAAAPVAPSAATTPGLRARRNGRAPTAAAEPADGVREDAGDSQPPTPAPRPRPARSRRSTASAGSR